MLEDHPIYKAIDKGGGQTCDVRGVMRELRAAGFVIVPHDISDKACDAALRATGNWLDIKGSGLTINREKMRRRWRNALTFYKNEIDDATKHGEGAEQ